MMKAQCGVNVSRAKMYFKNKGEWPSGMLALLHLDSRFPPSLHPLSQNNLEAVHDFVQRSYSS